MDIGKRFLPIGTVVLLKGGKKELMIISYCIVPAGDVYDKNGKVEVEEEVIYDYGGCVYPEGMITSDQLFAFNHDQIEKICYKGYETDAQKEISKVLDGGIRERAERIAARKENREPVPVTIEDEEAEKETTETAE